MRKKFLSIIILILVSVGFFFVPLPHFDLKVNGWRMGNWIGFAQQSGRGNLSGQFYHGAVYAEDFGALHNTRYIYDATTNSTTTVTCPNSDCNFVNANAPGGDVGKIVWGIYPEYPSNLAGGIGQSQGILVIPQGTITTVNNANSIVVSNSANASHTANVILIWGSDDTTALSDAFSAATAVTYSPCLTIVLPAGYLTVQHGLFNSPGLNCFVSSALNRIGIRVYGQGPGATQLIITPNFNWTSNIGPENAEFGDYNNATFQWGGGTDFENWAINGFSYGANGPSSATNYVIAPNNNSLFRDWFCLGVGGANTHLGGVRSYGVPAMFRNFQIDGCGGAVGINVTGGEPAFSDQSYSGDMEAVAFEITGSDVVAVSAGSIWGPVGGTTNNVITIDGTGSYFYSTNDTVLQGSGGSSESGLYNQLGTVTLTGDQLNENRSSSYAVYNSSTMHIAGTELTSSGTSGIAIGNSGTIYDDCGNTTSATITYSNSSGSLLGSCSILGSLVSGDIATTNFGSSPTLSAISGTSHDGTFTITTPSSGQSASPTVTLTFPAAFWVAPSYCQVFQTGGTISALTNPVSSSLGTTSVKWTWSGTPGASTTYVFSYHCGP